MASLTPAGVLSDVPWGVGRRNFRKPHPPANHSPREGCWQTHTKSLPHSQGTAMASECSPQTRGKSHSKAATAEREREAKRSPLLLVDAVVGTGPRGPHSAHLSAVC